MPENAPHITVIGGGTAGWLSALVLERAFKKQTKKSGEQMPRISVIESPDIPTVGVGEGSTSLFRQVLLDLEIDEIEFLKETGATFKFGIRHKNWSGVGSEYFGPIDDPHQLVPPPSGAEGSWLHTACVASGKDVQNAHLFTYLMRTKKSPFVKDKSGEMIATSPFHHAYHFDQAKLGKFLASKSGNIDHIRQEVQTVQRDPQSGNIFALNFKNGESVKVDFVIDCTGFRRSIISQMGSEWSSYSSMLPLNKAMPFWREHNPDEDISPYTLAHACSSGWMWAIPTQQRVGCGYVFSDAHQSAEKAQLEIEQLLGEKIEPRGVISIDPGRLKKAWINNCVAIGLAQSFLEPLEATSIHGTLVQALLLTQTNVQTLVSHNFDKDRDRYNVTVAGQIDDFAQFINLHYSGGRTDSAFWKDMTSSGITKTVRDRLELWKKKPVERQDFPMFPAALPHVEEQLHIPVLDGLDLLPREPSKAVMANVPKIRMHARKTIEQITNEFKSAAKQAIGHREYLEGLS